LASPVHLPSVLRFGQFELNPASGELRKAGIPIKIGPQPFRVLLLLGEHPRQVVTRKEIQRCLWGDDTFVDYEHGINFCVNQIRAALCDDAERPRYIETLPRRGYRFIASVSREIPAEPAPARAPIDISSVPRPVEPPQAVTHIPELQVMPQQRSRTHRRKWMLIAGVSVVGLVLCLYWVAGRLSTPAREPKATQVTANSVDNPVTSSAISPDGKYLAFTDKSMRMHLRLLATGETQTVPEPEAFAKAPVEWTITAWFPDSTRFLANASAPAGFAGTIHDRLRFGTIFHEVFRDPQEERSIWIVSVFGTPPEKLRDDAEAFSVSGDGLLVAFGTKRSQLGDREIWLMDSKGQQAHKLYDAPAETALAGFSWLQDGQRAIYFKFGDSTGQLIARDLNGGPAVTLVSFPDQERLSDFISLPDGRLIYAQSDDPPRRSCNFWELRMDRRTAKPLSRPRQLTSWSGSCAEAISATSDGKHLVFQRSQRQTTVNVGELEANGAQLTGAKHLTLNEYVNAAETWTPDGKTLVFRSIRDGHLRLFKQSLDSDVEEPLVLGAENVAGAAVSPDGSWLFYLACGPTTDECGDDTVPLMRIPMSGGTPYTVLTSDTYGRPRCAVSPSKLCVFAEQNNDGEPIIFRAFDVHGPGPELARFETEPRTEYAWALSSDGTRIAILKFWDSQIHVLSLNGQAVRHLAVRGASHLAGIYWAADGVGWFTASQSPTGTALLHVDPHGATHPIWETKGNTMAYGLPSPDGRHLAIVQTVRSSNVWLLENF
jgi:DNA-binding winged helix-turn-helix (wHTH) protein/WD40 repeat protein